MEETLQLPFRQQWIVGIDRSQCQLAPGGYITNKIGDESGNAGATFNACGQTDICLSAWNRISNCDLSNGRRLEKSTTNPL